ncbi:TIM barrel protein [uncultured Microbacterium sp.]|uniref:TIM barrel protein n=1 Tax=uncultured Microbacterium sp. TaxID=191216 RepID=UPI0035CA6AF6
MHPAISINALCFPEATDLASLADELRAVNAHRATVPAAMLPDADRVRGWLTEAGCELEAVLHVMFGFGAIVRDAAVWESERTKLRRSIDIAYAADCHSVYGTTGGRGAMTWADAARCYLEVVAPCVAYAAERSIRLVLEPTPAAYADAHLLHTLRDTIDLAERAHAGVCIDIFGSWTDPDLDDQIRRIAADGALAQVADYVYGDRNIPCRAVPGDGAIPLRHIIDVTLSAGYAGVFDLELIGPRIDAEGHRAAVIRAADVLGGILLDAGV